MKRRRNFGILLAFALAVVAAPQAPQRADKPTESAHRSGPNGLEGWTLDWPVPDSGYGDERFAVTLVIARHSHVIRRVSGDSFIWRWIFWADGRQLAYETGPLHFSAACYLVRLSDGHQLDSYDCYHDEPPQQPEWVKALEASR
jgi:hypothetical protein